MQAQIEKLSIKLQLEQLQQLSELLHKRIALIDQKLETLMKKVELLTEGIKENDDNLEKLSTLRKSAIDRIYTAKDSISEKHGEMKTIDMHLYNMGVNELLKRLDRREISTIEFEKERKQLAVKYSKKCDLSDPINAEKYAKTNRSERTTLDEVYSPLSNNVQTIDNNMFKNEAEKAARECARAEAQKEIQGLQQEKNSVQILTDNVDTRLGLVQVSAPKTFTLPLPQDKVILEIVEAKVETFRKMEKQVSMNAEKYEKQPVNIELKSEFKEKKDLLNSITFESDNDEPAPEPLSRTMRH